MPPQGFFGDPTSALLPATARSGTNGNWFFGYKGKSRASPQPGDYWSKEEVIRRGASILRQKRQRRLANAAQLRRPSFGGPRAANSKFRANYSKRVKESEDAAMKKAAEAAEVKRVMAKVKAAAYPTPGGPLYGFGTISDSLSGVVKPGPPNMRTFPMLGAYPGEVGPGNTPGGTADNGSFPGTENSLMSYFFTYGRRRSVRKKARRSARKKARRSVRRSMRRC